MGFQQRQTSKCSTRRQMTVEKPNDWQTGATKRGVLGLAYNVLVENVVSVLRWGWGPS